MNAQSKVGTGCPVHSDRDDRKTGQAAEQLGVSRVTLSKILNGKAGLTADMALRLAAWLNTSAEVWADMQTQWELWQAEQNPRPIIRPLKLAA